MNIVILINLFSVEILSVDVPNLFLNVSIKHIAVRTSYNLWNICFHCCRFHVIQIVFNPFHSIPSLMMQLQSLFRTVQNISINLSTESINFTSSNTNLMSDRKHSRIARDPMIWRENANGMRRESERETRELRSQYGSPALDLMFEAWKINPRNKR